MELRWSTNPQYTPEIITIQAFLNEARKGLNSQAIWPAITVDGYFGAETANALESYRRLNNIFGKQYGVISNQEFSNYSQLFPLLGNGVISPQNVNSNKSIVKKGSTDNVVYNYVNIISTLFSFVCDNLKEVFENHATQLCKGNQKNEQIVEMLKRMNISSTKRKNEALKEAKKLMAGIDDIKLSIEKLNFNNVWRRILGMTQSTTSQDYLKKSGIKRWEECRNQICKALKNYNINKRTRELLQKYELNGQIELNRVNKFRMVSKSLGVIGIGLQLAPLIYCMCTYDGSEESNNRLTKEFYEFMDNLLIDLIEIALGLIVAILVVLGYITLETAAIIGIIIGAAIFFIGILFFILEANEIYPAEYLQDIGYQLTYKIIY